MLKNNVRPVVEESNFEENSNLDAAREEVRKEKLVVKNEEKRNLKNDKKLGKGVKVEDRSAFNCVPCKGLGLVENLEGTLGKICSNCNGTGKVA